jgi:hypothetical protein
MADKNGGDKKPSQKEVKKVLKDDYKKSGSSGKFEKKWGLPKPPKKYIEAMVIAIGLGASISFAVAAEVKIKIQSPRPAIEQVQMSRKEWLRNCYRGCESKWGGWNNWQLQRCKADCRLGL